MASNKKTKLLIVFGTRPEALKLAPLILFARQDRRFITRVCLTGQHREMVDQVLDFFRIRPDHDLDLMVKGQTLSDLTQRLFPKMDTVFLKEKPDVVIVQGDTTTAFAVALKAFYSGIRVAHVEAGLRSHNKYQPFPEEINRVLVTHLADFHFPPTQESAGNLLKEGVKKERIKITGNTIVDTLLLGRTLIEKRRPPIAQRFPENGKRIVLVTAHRRESFGKPLISICKALNELTVRHKDIEIIYPVHLNPQVQKTVREELSGKKRIHLIAPLSYEDLLYLLNRCYLVLTDSGGIQEEAPSFGKPVLVMREVSERPDGIRLGVAKLVGTDRKKIVKEAGKLLDSPSSYRKMVKKKNPYGDGKASYRILDALFDGLKKGKR